jgi:L-fucose mutarotase
MFARHLTRLARPLAMSASRRPFHATATRLGLLKGMDPILTADLLHVLRSAGHGDEITLVDCNFPAASTATKTVTGTPIVLAGCDLPTAVDAICSIMPLDFFVDCPALCADHLLLVMVSAHLPRTSSAPMHHLSRSEP